MVIIIIARKSNPNSVLLPSEPIPAVVDPRVIPRDSADPVNHMNYLIGSAMANLRRVLAGSHLA